MPFPEASAGSLPWITVAQMREVDRVAEEIGLSLTRMMENAGAALASVAREMLGGDVSGARVAVLAGGGGNGGGGLVCARRLAAAGAQVAVCIGRPRGELDPVPAEQLAILAEMGVVPGDPSDDADLVVDALLGYGQSGSPRGRFAELASWAAGRRVLALDGPTGVSFDDGSVWEPAIRAEATLTLALPKVGLRDCSPTGDLLLGDISIPSVVYERCGIRYRSPFGAGPVLRIGSSSGCS